MALLAVKKWLFGYHSSIESLELEKNKVALLINKRLDGILISLSNDQH
jgi:hypothetical protein